MRAAVEAGDLATALEERTALPPDGQAASADWAALAGQRVALDRALAALAGEIAEPAPPAPDAAPPAGSAPAPEAPAAPAAAGTSP
jgi:hypothetical protein